MCKLIDYLNVPSQKLFQAISLPNFFFLSSHFGLGINSTLQCTLSAELRPTAEALHLASQLHKLQIDIPERLFACTTKKSFS